MFAADLAALYRPPVRASGGSPPLGPAAPIGQHAPPCVPAHAAAGLARAFLTSAPATRLAGRGPVAYITPTICPLERCTMVANDAPHWFPDHREGERRLLPLRRSGLDRRYQSMPPTVELRGAGERRVLADRRTWTERRQHVTAE